MNILTHQHLRSILSYDPNTGVFIWLVKPSGNVRIGAVAGKGKLIGIDKQHYTKARLAWFWVYGHWPQTKTRMRFIDNNPNNVRINNLSDESVPFKCDWKSLKARNAYIKSWNDSHPGKARNAYLKSVFGITLMQYESMHDAQDGKCAICQKIETSTRAGKVKRLCVDHDHKTNVVRELLCDRCNVVLGLINDDPELLVKLFKYISKHTSKSENKHVA